MHRRLCITLTLKCSYGHISNKFMSFCVAQLCIACFSRGDRVNDFMSVSECINGFRSVACWWVCPHLSLNLRKAILSKFQRWNVDFELCSNCNHCDIKISLTGYSAKLNFRVKQGGAFEGRRPSGWFDVPFLSAAPFPHCFWFLELIC